LVLRVWEHEPPEDAADRIADAVTVRLESYRTEPVGGAPTSDVTAGDLD